MRSVVLSILAGVGLLATSSAVAQSNGLTPPRAPVSNPHDTIPNLAFEHVQPVLDEAGFKTQIAVVDGAQVMQVQAGKRNLALYRRACSTATNCAGLWIFAYTDVALNTEQLNAFNQGSKPARATPVQGKVALDRYLIADYGTTRGSLVVNVAVMAGMIDQLFRYSSEVGPVMVSFEPLFSESPPSATIAEHDLLEAMTSMRSMPGMVNIDATAPLNTPQHR